MAINYQMRTFLTNKQGGDIQGGRSGSHETAQNSTPQTPNTTTSNCNSDMILPHPAIITGEFTALAGKVRALFYVLLWFNILSNWVKRIFMPTTNLHDFFLKVDTYVLFVTSKIEFSNSPNLQFSNLKGCKGPLK